MAKKPDEDKEKEAKATEEVIQEIKRIQVPLLKVQTANSWRVKKLGALILMSRLIDNPDAEKALKSARIAAREHGRLLGEQSSELDNFLREFIKSKKKVVALDDLHGKLTALNNLAIIEYAHYKTHKAAFRKFIAKQFEKYSATLKKIIEEIHKEQEKFAELRREMGVSLQVLRLKASALVSK
ncbi:MAG: hypothetical protein JNM56_29235 [Planctomycetia bacterium]|nr:hypothetical protein [Planctomycetia bacterium]